MTQSATAAAHPNLAFVKYWGQRDPALNIPGNGSISMNLSGATTTTMVTFDADLAGDTISLNGHPVDERTRGRVAAHLDRVRRMAGSRTYAWVVSRNDFPADAGVASSASAFAALSLAAVTALGLSLSTRVLSILARKGSGSACRSIPDGFVEWLPGWDDTSSYARSLAPCDHWDLRVVTVAFPGRAKVVPSLVGHRAARTSPFYRIRLQEVTRNLVAAREAMLGRDFASLSALVERDALSLHAVALTSQPEGLPWLNGILYFAPETVQLLAAVPDWRRDGLPVGFTLDAGSSVHLICEAPYLDAVRAAIDSVDLPAAPTLIVSRPGRGAWLVKDDDGAEAPSDPSCTS